MELNTFSQPRHNEKFHSLSIKEACAILGIGRTKIYQLINQGILPAKKMGVRTIILYEDLVNYLSTLQSYPVQKGGVQ